MKRQMEWKRKGYGLLCVLFAAAAVLFMQPESVRGAENTGKAHLVIENTTYQADSVPTGTLLEKDIDIGNPWMTVMDMLVIENRNSEELEIEGLDQGKITSIKGLAAGAGDQEGAGWRILLNGWVLPNEQGDYAVKDGDEIRVAYTTNYGMDLGIALEGEDAVSTELKDLKFGSGALEPAFTRDEKDYILVLDAGVTEVTVSPVPVSTRFRSDVYKGKNPDTSKRGYGLCAGIPVKAGDLLTVVCSDPSDASIEKTTYTVRIRSGESDNYIPELAGADGESAVCKTGEQYTKELGDLFRDEDDESLTYEYRIAGDGNGEPQFSPVGEGTSFSKEFEKPGQYQLEFRAVDGKQAASPVYTVSLEVVDASATHTIEIKSGAGGSITADKTTAVKGETVTLTVEPEKAKALDTFTIVDGKSNAIERDLKTSDIGGQWWVDPKYYENANLKYGYEFVMPDSDVAVEGTFEDLALLVIPGLMTLENTVYEAHNEHGVEAISSTSGSDEAVVVACGSCEYSIYNDEGDIVKSGDVEIGHERKDVKIQKVKFTLNLNEEAFYQKGYGAGIKDMELRVYNEEGTGEVLVPFRKYSNEEGYNQFFYLVDFDVTYIYKFEMADERITAQNFYPPETYKFSYSENEFDNAWKEQVIRLIFQTNKMTFVVSKKADAKLYKEETRAYKQRTLMKWYDKENKVSGSWKEANVDWGQTTVSAGDEVNDPLAVDTSNPDYDVYRIGVQQGVGFFLVMGGGNTGYRRTIYTFENDFKDNVFKIFKLEEKDSEAHQAPREDDDNDLYTSLREMKNGAPQNDTADSTFINLKRNGVLASSVRLEGFRTTQTVLDYLTNQFIEPDMHFECIYTPDASVKDTLSPGGDFGRNYITFTASKKSSGGFPPRTSLVDGLRVIRVTYDDMTQYDSGSTVSDGQQYYFSPIDKENAGIIFIYVSENNDPSKIDPGMKIPTRTTSNKDGEIDLRSDYDTIYFLGGLDLPDGTETFEDPDGKKDNEYTFKPTAESGIQSVRYHAPVYADEGWTDDWQTIEADEDGAYTIELQSGRNIVEIKDNAGNVIYTTVKAKKVDIAVTNTTAQEDPDRKGKDEKVRAGDKIAVKFEGLTLPIYKMAGIYNPGYPATTWAEYTLNADETEDGKKKGTTCKGSASQYHISKYNTVRCRVDGLKNILSAGQIHCGHLGSALDSHLTIPDSGMGANFNASAGANDRYFGRLPDIRIKAEGREKEFEKLVEAIDEKKDLLGQIDKIRAAMEFYEDLTDEEKELESVKALYEKLERIYEQVANVIEVLERIDYLNDAPAMKNAKEIREVEELYKKLSDAEKKAITNYSKLQELIAYIQAVDDLIAKIEGLPEYEKLTMDDIAGLQEALAAYNGLSADQKAAVTNYSKLQNLLDRGEDLIAVKEVMDLIDQIGDLTELNYEEKEILILKARQLYEILDTDQKKLVENLAKLTDAEARLNVLKSDPDIRKLIELIQQLRDGADGKGDGPLSQAGNTWEVWKNWADYVKNVRAMVERIEKSRQGKITNLADLEAAEEQVKRIRVDWVLSLIRALPGETAVDYYDPSAAAAAEAAEYGGSLETAEAVVIGDEAEYADPAEAAEIAMPVEGYEAEPVAAGRQMTEEELSAIAAAKDEYDSLSAGEKELMAQEASTDVTKLEVLDEKAATYDGYVETVMQKFLDRVVSFAGTDGKVSRDGMATAKELLERYNSYPEARQKVFDNLAVAKNVKAKKLMSEMEKQMKDVEAEIAETERIDELILSLPSVVTADNLKAVEKQIAAIEKAIAKLSDDAKGYVYQMNRLNAIKELLAELGAEILDPDTPLDDMPLEEAKPKVTAKSAGYNSVKITWTKVSGAQSYRIYRQKNGKGSYTKIATVDAAKTSYTNKKLVTNRVYRYKVRAVAKTEAGTIYSKYGVSAKVKPVPAKAAITKVKAGKRTLKVTWKKVSGASGYVVYRASSKNGKYKAVKTVKSGKTISWKNTKLKGGKKYYYKVRAYRIVSGKKVYGSYSAKASGKAKK